MRRRRGVWVRGERLSWSLEVTLVEGKVVKNLKDMIVKVIWNCLLSCNHYCTNKKWCVFLSSTSSTNRSQEDLS